VLLTAYHEVVYAFEERLTSEATGRQLHGVGGTQPQRSLLVVCLCAFFDGRMFGGHENVQGLRIAA
jgi:hypothetical protein